MAFLKAAVDKARQETQTFVSIVGLIKEEVLQRETGGLVTEVERIKNIELGMFFGRDNRLGAIGRVLVLGMAAFGLLLLDIVGKVAESLRPSQVRAVLLFGSIKVARRIPTLQRDAPEARACCSDRSVWPC